MEAFYFQGTREWVSSFRNGNEGKRQTSWVDFVEVTRDNFLVISKGWSWTRWREGYRGRQGWITSFSKGKSCVHFRSLVICPRHWLFDFKSSLPCAYRTLSHWMLHAEWYARTFSFNIDEKPKSGRRQDDEDPEEKCRVGMVTNSNSNLTPSSNNVIHRRTGKEGWRMGLEDEKEGLARKIPKVISEWLSLKLSGIINLPRLNGVDGVAGAKPCLYLLPSAYGGLPKFRLLIVQIKNKTNAWRF